MEDPTKGYAPPVYPYDAYPPQQPSYDPNYPVAPQTGYPHTAQQYNTTNFAVVQSQPQPAPRPTTNARRIGKNDKGLVFAIVASFIAFCCGGLIPLTCTIAALVLALKAQESEDAGDEEKMKQFHKLSLILSTVGTVAAVIIGVLSIVLYIVLYSATVNANANRYN